MILTIDLSDEQQATLAAEARTRGLSPEEYARQLPVAGDDHAGIQD
jgi:hypothetical protein